MRCRVHGDGHRWMVGPVVESLDGPRYREPRYPSDLPIRHVRATAIVLVCACGEMVTRRVPKPAP